MENVKKIKVKFKSPKGTIVGGMIDSDIPKAATLKEDARKLRAANLRKENLKEDARKLRAENLRNKPSEASPISVGMRMMNKLSKKEKP